MSTDRTREQWQLSNQRLHAENADLRAKAADAKAIAVDAVAEVARARKHACASCVREFEALEEAGLDPERSYSEQVRKLRADLASALLHIEVLSGRITTSARRDE